MHYLAVAALMIYNTASIQPLQLQASGGETRLQWI